MKSRRIPVTCCLLYCHKSGQDRRRLHAGRDGVRSRNDDDDEERSCTIMSRSCLVVMLFVPSFIDSTSSQGAATTAATTWLHAFPLNCTACEVSKTDTTTCAKAGYVAVVAHRLAPSTECGTQVS